VGTRGGYGETPLMIAAERADQDLATTLLDRGARIDARDDYDRTVLMWAVGPMPQFGSHGSRIEVADPAAGKRPALICELIRRGADPDALGAQPDSILDR